MRQNFLGYARVGGVGVIVVLAKLFWCALDLYYLERHSTLSHMVYLEGDGIEVFISQFCFQMHEGHRGFHFTIFLGFWIFVIIDLAVHFVYFSLVYLLFICLE
jgi:hypothetical protein